jgi:hypothetical protein
MVGRALRRGRIATALSLWQWRDLANGSRTGLHVLVAGSSDVQFLGTVPPDQHELEF